MTAPQSLVASISLIIALLIYAIWSEGLFANHRGKPHLDCLLEHKDRLLERLRSLRFEYYSGKCTEDEFLMREAQLENEASQLLAEIIDVQRHSV